MRVFHRLCAAGVLVAVSGCVESIPTAAEPAMRGVAGTAFSTDGDTELKRPRVNVTGWVDETVT